MERKLCETSWRLRTRVSVCVIRVICMSNLIEHIQRCYRAGQRSRYSDWLRAGRSEDRIPVGVRFSAPVQTSPRAHSASCAIDTGSFPGVKSGRGVTLTLQHLLMPWSWMSRAIPLLPYGPYGLYNASVPVQGCTLPLPFTKTQWEINNKISVFMDC